MGEGESFRWIWGSRGPFALGCPGDLVQVWRRLTSARMGIHRGGWQGHVGDGATAACEARSAGKT